MINLYNFVEIKIFLIKFFVIGIISVNGKFFGIEINLLYLLNFDFEVINKISVIGDLDDIIFDVLGNIIYCCYERNIVIKKNKVNKIMFVYKYLN